MDATQENVVPPKHGDSFLPHPDDEWMEPSDGNLLENAVKKIFAPCIGAAGVVSVCTGPTGPATGPSTADVGREQYFSMANIRRLFGRLDKRSTTREGKIIDVPTQFAADDMSAISAETLEEIEELTKQLQLSFSDATSIGIPTSGSDSFEDTFVTEFHTTIHILNWDLLKFRLKQLRWEIECRSSTNSTKESIQESFDEAPLFDNLLAVDHLGRTPLHLACEKDAPFVIIQQLIDLQPRAAASPDTNGRYAIHIVARTERTEEEMFTLASAFPRALVEFDSKGRSPLSSSLDQVMQDMKSFSFATHTGRWGTVYENDELSWQKHQKQAWRNISTLLSVMLRLNKAVHPTEQGEMIMQAMEAGSPPTVVKRMMKCTRKNQQSKIFQRNLALCAKCIALVFKFSYPLSVLQDLLDAASYDVQRPPRKVLAALRRGLIGHYEEGFKKRIKNDHAMLTLRKGVIRCHRNHRSRLDRRAGEDNTMAPTSMNDACREWFDKLSFLLIHTTTDDPQALASRHILHVALSNPTSPKSLIELIVNVYPQSRKKKDPRSGALPLHIACFTDNVDSLDAVLVSMVMGEHNSHWVWRRFQDRLPLHHALTSGKLCSFVEPLVRLDSSTLLVRDPVTKLYPFQLAAIDYATVGSGTREDSLQGASSNSSMYQARRYPPLAWRRETFREEEKSDAKTIMEVDDDLKQLTTIYELIKMNPNAIGSGSLTTRTLEIESMALDSAGVVSSTYLSWLYLWSKDTGWSISSIHMELAQAAIELSDIPREMNDFWNKILTLIWDERSAGLGLAQRDDQYLLHCALTNADVPSLMIELLVMIFPHAVSIPLPGTSIFPVHLAAATPTYVSQDFEVPYPGTSLEILAEMTPRSILIDSSTGRSVLHIAIEERKSREQLCQLANVEKTLLLTADPKTGMLPFQLMAVKKGYTPDQTRKLIAEAKSLSPRIRWASLSTAQKSRFLRKRYEKEDRDCLSTLYEFIRAEPSVIEAAIKQEEQTSSQNDEEAHDDMPFEEPSGEKCRDIKLVEMVVRDYEGRADSSEFDIEFCFDDDDDADSGSNTGAVEMAVREAADSGSIDESECVHDMLFAGCERWRDVGMLLKQAMCQHDRVSSQIAESKKVLDMYDGRTQKR
jgi:hypothetical protein